ncbi:energy transducer TonB [Hymenobacter actinosclerus]|uniref:Protein TonB n=1 Tax=Hymenobacter actinosclerus TaxID=82805 RepID=A0A1I0IXT8_9BACT|nr:energy transducer TonB [Hymenobacter actinosclerus]SEU02169.1 protein TonB [Hymenobacter actinosclerus]
MNARPLLLLLLLLPLLPAAAVAQASYNRWEARPPAPIVPLPRKTSPRQPRPAPAPEAAPTRFDSVALTSGGYARLETAPTFPGGAQAMYTVIGKHLKRPAGPRQRGAVLVRFTVLASGAVADIGVVPGRGLNPTYDAAAVAAVGRLPPLRRGSAAGSPPR